MTSILVLTVIITVAVLIAVAEVRAHHTRQPHPRPRHAHQPRHARTPHPGGFPGWPAIEAEHDAWLATYDPPSPYQRRLPLILWERDTLAGGILRPIRAEVTG